MKIAEGLFHSSRNERMRVICLLLCLLLFVVFAGSLSAKINVTGTKEQKEKLAKWLTSSLGAKVTIDDEGKLSVGEGGGEAADRLRKMGKDDRITITVELVSNDDNVLPSGKVKINEVDDTKSKIIIDIGDLDKLGNTINSNGVTHDTFIVGTFGYLIGLGATGTQQEADSVYFAVVNELMAEHGTKYVGKAMVNKENGKIKSLYSKIKTTSGKYLVLKVIYDNGKFKDFEWYKEKEPCKFTEDTLILIPDPDPQVHVLNYDPLLDHSFSGTIDTEDSAPTAIAFDSDRHVYVAENFPEDRQDEVRIFTEGGELINTYAGEEILNPEGIAVDAESGEIFVAVAGRVIRYDSHWERIGTYVTEDEAFTPTDVAIWRDYPDIDNPAGEGNVYEIFVTDRASRQIYRFDAAENMNNGSYMSAFGADYLNAPEGLFVATSGMVWVASTGNNRIYRFSMDGELMPLRSYEDFLNPEVVSEYFIEDMNRSFFDLERTTISDLYVVDHTPGKGALLRYDAFNAELLQTYGEGKLQCPASVATMWKYNLDNLELTASPDEAAAQGAFWPWILGGAAALLIVAVLYFVIRRNR